MSAMPKGTASSLGGRAKGVRTVKPAAVKRAFNSVCRTLFKKQPPLKTMVVMPVASFALIAMAERAETRVPWK